MPLYEYEHMETPCDLGQVFEISQPLADEPLTACPKCGGPVRKLLSAPRSFSTHTNAELRDAGFSKLVRRDKGVYENVTAQGKQIIKLPDEDR
ncbi:MAG: zinc ribbon domain-containing protein [Desulfovibrio sp.]|nr:MAG: zinc ribbon domain-containing protein [Desulfovibrio sp.]